MKRSHHYALVGFLLTTIIVGNNSIANTGIYKWQDENGTWHFSKTPPNDQAVESVDIRITPPSSKVSQQETPTDTTTNEQHDTPPLPVSEEIAAEERARLEKNCTLAKKNLSNLENHSRIRHHDSELGEERYLTPDEHVQWVKNSKETIKESCL